MWNGVEGCRSLTCINLCLARCNICIISRRRDRCCERETTFYLRGRSHDPDGEKMERVSKNENGTLRS
jgi:hypothetical protein